MTLEKRLAKLEKATGGKRVVLIVQFDGQPNPTEAEEEAAIEAHIAKHGEGDGFIVLYWDGEHFKV